MRGGWGELELSHSGREALLNELKGHPNADRFIVRAEFLMTMSWHKRQWQKEETSRDEHQQRFLKISELAKQLGHAIERLPDDTAEILADGFYGARPWREKTIQRGDLDRIYRTPIQDLTEMADWAIGQLSPISGRPEKRIRLFLAVELARAYRELLNRNPGRSMEGPFDRILAIVFQEIDLALEEPEFYVRDRRDIIADALEVLDKNAGGESPDTS